MSFSETTSSVRPVEPPLRGVDHRQAFVELVEIVAGRPRRRLQPRADPRADIVEPVGHQARQIRLAGAEPSARF